MRSKSATIRSLDYMMPKPMWLGFQAERLA
jgi:hypothetical protein